MKTLYDDKLATMKKLFEEMESLHRQEILKMTYTVEELQRQVNNVKDEEEETDQSDDEEVSILGQISTSNFQNLVNHSIREVESEENKSLPIQVHILQKRRGSHGSWERVSQGEGLRVTKGVGKLLRLDIRTQEKVEKGSQNFNIELWDLSGTSPLQKKDWFSVEKIEQNDPTYSFVEVRLNASCKKLQFRITVTTVDGPLQANSVEFGAHSHGKVGKTNA